MRLKDEKYEFAKKEVAYTIFEYKLKYPIDIFDLAKRMGFVLVPYSSFKDDKTKLLNFSEDGFNYFQKDINTHYIYYNDEIEEKGRIKITIGHEIGHLILNCNDNSEESNSLADFFSVYLLAPVVLIIENKLNSKEKIQNFFLISEQASENSLDRAIKRFHCNSRYKDYENYIINSQKN